MGITFEGLLKVLVEFRDVQFRSEPERDAARIENLEYVIQTMLEKLRDIHDR